MTSAPEKVGSDARAVAARHGLHLVGDIALNDTGLDFRVAFATDTDGRPWVLRIPRRDDVELKVEREARILDFVKNRLPVEVPDWQVCSRDLVAYPMLTDPTALVFDADTHTITWNIDKGAEAYVTSLAYVLVALHESPPAEAVAAGISASSPEEVRVKISQELETVKQEIGIGRGLEDRCRRWLDHDALWPAFSVLTHGDLYAGHVTVASDGRVRGVIDWTEAEVGDPSIDFAGHLPAFGAESLKQLVAAYESAGGRIWPGMVEHINERHAVASPIRYGVFAIGTGDEQHVAAARAQLGVG